MKMGDFCEADLDFDTIFNKRLLLFLFKIISALFSLISYWSWAGLPVFVPSAQKVCGDLELGEPGEQGAVVPVGEVGVEDGGQRQGARHHAEDGQHPGQAQAGAGHGHGVSWILRPVEMARGQHTNITANIEQTWGCWVLLLYPSCSLTNLCSLAFFKKSINKLLYKLCKIP